MPIAIDNITPVNTGNTGTSYVIPHITAGANRGMLIFVSSTSQSLPSGITYAGAALTPEGNTLENGFGRRISIWSRIQPGTGSNNAILAFPSAVAAAVTIITLTDVNQLDMVGNYVGTQGGGSDVPSILVSSDADELVFDALTSTLTATAGAGQTPRSNHGNAFIRGAVSSEPGAASNTMSWSLASDNWALAAVNVRPHAGGLQQNILSRCVIPLSQQRLAALSMTGWTQGPVSGGDVPPSDQFFCGFPLG